MSEGDVRPVVIFDTTLRDGEQAPGFSLREKEKVRLAHQLDELNVDILEAGFPIASEDDFRAVQAVAREVKRPTIAALARCVPADVERAAEALEDAARARIHTFIATSDLHLEKKLRITRAECLEATARCVAQAKRYVEDVEFSAEDAARSDLDFLVEVVTVAVDAGATTINLPDTVGYALPDEITRLFRAVRDRVPGSDGVMFSAHCHDDLGLAVANSIAALDGGASQIECTVNGIGERAGNASLEEFVMALRVRADRLPYTTRIHSRQLLAASQLLVELTGEPVQANKAIVGRNAFAHEAGIHQDGILKDRRTYEIMHAADVGVPATTLVLGKHSGRHALKARCEVLQLPLSRLELDELYRRMIRLAEVKKVVHDPDLLALFAELRRAERGHAHARPAGHEAKENGGGRLEDHAVHEEGYGHGV
jgi:2-isopropylmalate synthase